MRYFIFFLKIYIIYNVVAVSHTQRIILGLSAVDVCEIFRFSRNRLIVARPFRSDRI